MDTLQALILGIVQGLAEYLPISSSGHLEIFKDIFGLQLSGADSLEFDVVLHVATVLSTIVVLWREFVPLCTSFFTLKRDANTTYVWKLLLSCIPIGIVGLCFKHYIEALFDGSLVVVGVCLCVTALLLTFSYYFRRGDAPTANGKSYAGHDITWADAFIMGLAQAVAVLPGLSRSGTTIATGLLLGDRRDQVAQFSFFMVVIPILGEALLDLKDIISPDAEAIAESATQIDLVPMIVGFIAAFVVGCAACKWMIDIVKRGKLVWFAVYCLMVGMVCLIYSFA